MITGNVVLAAIWLVLSLIFLFCFFLGGTVFGHEKEQNAFVNGIKLSMWIVGSVICICSVIIYNNQFK